MDIRARYLKLVNMLMFVLGIGLAVFVVTTWAGNDREEAERGEQTPSPHTGTYRSPVMIAGEVCTAPRRAAVVFCRQGFPVV